MEKISFTKGKSIFVIDLALIPVFALVIYSGLKLHIAGHNNHAIWSYWAYYHTLIGVLSLVLGWFHVKAHWGWYRGLISKGIGKKSKVTFGLSLLFLLVTLTAVILILFIDGANSAIGLWHYKAGLVMSFLLTIHLIKRFTLLVKGLKRKI